jgi:O-antigen/teichoic acid export membrane protein
MQRNDLLTLRRTVKVYTFIFLSIVLIAILLSPEILWILGGQNYMNSVHMIPVVMVSYVFMFVYSLYANIQFFHKKQRSIAFGTILAAILNVSLNYVLIGKFGYTAAAYTTLIGYIFLVIYNYAMTRRIGKHIYYETFFFIKMLIISIFSIPVIQFLYNFFILRYMLMIVIFMVFIFISLKKKEKIKEAIRTRSIIGLIKAYNDK